MANDRDNPKHLQLAGADDGLVGRPAMGVRVAKIASYNDIILSSRLAPVVPLPKFPGAVTDRNPRWVLGLTRQEASSTQRAVSTAAGARGLMQLSAEPTANANRRGAPHDLSAERPYRRSEIAICSSAWRAPRGIPRTWGADILAIAAYNGGHAVTNKWVEANGDPRDPTIDPIDWIELIPFGETANTFGACSENIELYRNPPSGSE